MKSNTATISLNDNRPLANAKVSFVESQPESSQGLPQPSIIEITNLCERIACCSSELSQYGSLLGGLNQYLVQPLSKADSELPRKITLESLLSGESGHTLDRQERLHIALILASSYIQLHPTPWLKSKWSKKDIFFFYGSGSLGNICTNKPYISRDLSDTVPDLQTDNSGGFSCTTTIAFQDSIRNLGIMLLELCFGKAIEEGDEWKNVASNITNLDERMLQFVYYSAASKWCSRVRGEAGPEYLSAVQWCLHHVADGISDEKADAWREDMFASVVEPLKTCHSHLCTTSLR